MSGIIEQFLGFTCDTGMKMYYDKSMNNGTRALFDMSSKAAGGKINIPAGGIVSDLSFDPLEGVFNKAKNYSGGGMQFAGVGNDTFSLPPLASPQPEDKHWLFTLWVKISKPGSNSFNNRTFHFGKAGNGAAVHTVFGLIPTAVDGEVTQVELRVNGRQFIPGLSLSPLYDGSVRQLGIEVERSESGLQQRVTACIDTVQVWSTGWSNLPDPLPYTAAQGYIGTSGTFPMAWTGSFYRARLDDLSLSGLSASEVLSLDYASSRHRFS